MSASTTVPDFLAAAERLIGPVDAFFDNVFVMAEDEGVRRNRLALLRCHRPQQGRRRSMACLRMMLLPCSVRHASLPHCYVALCRSIAELPRGICDLSELPGF